MRGRIDPVERHFARGSIQSRECAMVGQVQQISGSGTAASASHNIHGHGDPQQQQGLGYGGGGAAAAAANAGSGTGDAVMARWLQSAGLQHLAAPLAAAALDHRLLPSLLMQDYARYGVQSLEDKQKLFRLIKTISSGPDHVSEPSTPPQYVRSASQIGMDSILSPELRGDFGAGILDIHAMDDSELLSEAGVAEPFEPSPSFVPVIERGFEADPDIGGGSRLPSSRLKSRTDESPLRSTSNEKDRAVGKDNGLARIKVVVRKRPINKKELGRKEEDIITIEDSGCSVMVHEPKLKVDLTAYVERHEFVFDAVLDDHVTNDEVYRVTVEPIVPTIFQRTKATCFAYGQTGSGKTYTMQPLPLRASKDMLDIIQHPANRGQQLQLWLSFFEIYGGKLYDLLNDRRKLCMREDGRQQVCIVGLKEFQVSDVQIVRDYIDRGNSARSTGSTGANEESSRSHAILQLVVKKAQDRVGRIIGKMSFIDLAGSERGADTTDNDRQTRMEGAEINKSLLALKECIRALDNDQGHIPFRGSKLTEVLRDSFVGDSRTVMISCISPNTGSCEHTLNTLRYADRVKGLSKNSNAKRDPVATREITSSPPLSSPLQSLPQLSEDSRSLENGKRSLEQFGWPNEPEMTSAFSGDSSNNGARDDGRLLSASSERERQSFRDTNGQYDYPGPTDNDQDRPQIVLPSRRRTVRDEKVDRYPSFSSKDEPSDLQYGNPKRANYKDEVAPAPLAARGKELRDTDMVQMGYDGQINAILEEEEEVISAHRKEVEDTMEIVREEMRLLAEVDQPGSRIDRYVSQLNYLLSRKAAGIVNLQARLARFQRHLKEQEILSRTGALR
ncbi:kinesin-like protein KIN-13A [Selaginella moellendorffii]|uniref:kinesin-like protein KIN-13A n=1 Tax=Selaginella moellendorffii TaxID=88036 RepID=UPI000D1C68DC|nr:kinesin-like protein KIN-13A [Selaginella moellendorffii]XP_024529614.1 kinesin-like protein KIN-13A [Selaginella moellendorffii]|eukprot:XP_024529613.1 kinesin-like protein KIN-13A [Selaginella moellendorffii]